MCKSTLKTPSKKEKIKKVILFCLQRISPFYKFVSEKVAMGQIENCCACPHIQ
jgi:hypothetical protein